MIKNKIFLDQNLLNLLRSQYLQHLRDQLHKIPTELSTDFVGNFLMDFAKDTIRKLCLI